ncbi:DUF4833 domain-containing protein [Lacinutrix iliipiscaria]|uniref:DUF4833 domain-containing protein n=1 Tax=Lacinutrix iliipiscaria TaxID=1230532 RepID=A0ABW5WQ45_9FLAO
MKAVLLFLLINNFTFFLGYSQEDYPVPKKTDSRLFYIQHSNNHNTYVYDANIKDGAIDLIEPIEEYRIVYNEDGEKKPLTLLQKRLAYGVVLLSSDAKRVKFRLAVSEDLFFYLTYNDNEGARIYVTVNDQKMYLEKMFLKLKNKNTGINLKAEYILFYGKDFYSNQSITEKLILKQD